MTDTLAPILTLTEALAFAMIALLDHSMLPVISLLTVPLFVTDTVMLPPGPSLYLVPFHQEGMW